MINKKGFTLVELLAVIVILGVLLTLATLGVIRIINNATNDVGNFTEKQIKDAATTFALSPDFDKACEIESDDCDIATDEKSLVLEGKGSILEYLSPYYPEMENKCSIGIESSVIIYEENDDIRVEIENINCME